MKKSSGHDVTKGTAKKPPKKTTTGAHPQVGDIMPIVVDGETDSEIVDVLPDGTLLVRVPTLFLLMEPSNTPSEWREKAVPSSSGDVYVRLSFPRGSSGMELTEYTAI